MRYTQRPAQGQFEQAHDRQAELNRRLAVIRAPAAFAVGATVPAHVLVKPNKQRAAPARSSAVREDATHGARKLAAVAGGRAGLFWLLEHWTQEISIASAEQCRVNVAWIGVIERLGLQASLMRSSVWLTPCLASSWFEPPVMCWQA